MIPATMNEARNSKTAPAMLATVSSAVLARCAELRLQALDERRQILVGSRPCGVDLLADDRPFGDARRGRGNHQRVVVHAVDEVVHRVAQRAHQHGGRQDDDHDAHERQQRRRKPLPSAHLARQLLMRRIQRDRQDQRPRHQADEGRKDLVAEHRQGQHQSCPDQDVHQPSWTVSSRAARSVAKVAFMVGLLDALRRLTCRAFDKA